MTLFRKLARKPPPCDVCGGVMLAMWGGGWDNDRIVCADRLYCGAEIQFATSTPLPEPKQKKKSK